MINELKKVGISIVIIIVVAILLLQFYVSEITVNQPIREGNYFVSDDSLALYWKVYENETADIYLFSFENGEVKSGVKMNMKCYYDWLNPFFGDYYFKSDSIFSLEKIEIDGDLSYLSMKCKNAISYDFQTSIEYDASSAIEEYTEEFPFAFCNNNSIFIDGGYAYKTLSAPETLEYYINYLDNLSND